MSDSDAFRCLYSKRSLSLHREARSRWESHSLQGSLSDSRFRTTEESWLPWHVRLSDQAHELQGDLCSNSDPELKRETNERQNRLSLR